MITKPIIILEVDWEEKLREYHKRPSSVKPGTGNAIHWATYTKTLNARIKEVRKLVAEGLAVYK